MRQVMISYSTRQRPFAEALHRRLEANGCVPKLDHLDIPTGALWRQTIAWWLSACQTAVVLLSPSAIDSPWVRYELGVLVHRSQTLGNVQLVVVYLGITRKTVCAHPDFSPFALREIQSPPELASAEPDDDVLEALAAHINELAGDGATSIDPLVDRVHDELRDTGPAHLERALARLHDESTRTGDDPWLAAGEVPARRFARAFCSTPLYHTYSSLDVLARDRKLTGAGVLELVDLNVMTTFDAKLVDHLHRAAQPGDRRRSLAVAITQADIAGIAARSVHEHGDTRSVFSFVINAPITGTTATHIADGVARELIHAIEAIEEGADAEEVLEDLAELGHPVYALLARAEGITTEVLAELERRFPTVVFLVLASFAHSMPRLAAGLGVDGAGPALEGEAWARYVEHERQLAAERLRFRRGLLRVRKERDG